MIPNFRDAVPARLSLMMVLVYAVQGAWWPLLAVLLDGLGLDGWRRGWIYGALPVACVLMPLGVGRMIDRHWPIQKYLARTFAMGGALLLFLGFVGPMTFPRLLTVMLLYWLVVAPAYGMTNTMAMRNLPRPSEQYARVRLWGTVGWMAAGWLVTGLLLRANADSDPALAFRLVFLASGLVALLTAGYCLTLPHTPPAPPSPRSGPRAADMLDLLRDRSVAVYLFLAFGVSLTTPFMFQVIPLYLQDRGLSPSWITSVMTIGQVPEIVALALLPVLSRRWGLRLTLATGIGAWILRHGSLTLGPPMEVAVAGILLHGVAIANFSILGQMHIDARAPGHRRASTQALNVVITSGLGALLGSLLAGVVADRFGGDYRTVFLVPCLINVAMLLVLLRCFPAHHGTPEESESPLPDPVPAPMAAARPHSSRAESSIGSGPKRADVRVR